MKQQNKNTLTLGSLFDGSGGFPLGGVLAGITPIFNSEIEPFPVRVTGVRFPNMKHYGDISTLKGSELEPVDIITFGSPCQDMSVAGKREGLDGNRSSLFYEAIKCQYLNLQNGKMQDASWETVSVSHGDSSMLSIGVFPKEDNESTLSQILMEGVPEKYYLSPKACQGILRRASSRGKTLPTVLQKALEKQAAKTA